MDFNPGTCKLTPEQIKNLKAKDEREKVKKRKGGLSDLDSLYNEILDFNHLAFPSLLYSYKSRIPSKSGIYFLYRNQEIFYVGQSVDMKLRWSSHDVESKIVLAPNLVSDPNLRIGWIEIHKDLLDFAEKYLIGLLHPVLNIAHREPV